MSQLPPVRERIGAYDIVLSYGRHHWLVNNTWLWRMQWMVTVRRASPVLIDQYVPVRSGVNLTGYWTYQRRYDALVAFNDMKEELARELALTVLKVE